MAVAVAVLTATAIAAPASAVDLDQHPRIVGSIDDVKMVYWSDADINPTLRVSGWGANLNVGSSNGNGWVMAVELVATRTGGGGKQTVGWAEGDEFTLPRPDIANAYPGLGADHGWMTDTIRFLPGTWQLCAQVWDLDAAMPDGGWINVSCKTVTIPPSRTPYRPVISGDHTVGSTITTDTAASHKPANATVSYQWTRAQKTIPGDTGSSHKMSVADINQWIGVETTLRQPGQLVVLQTVDPIAGEYGQLTMNRVQGTSRYQTAVAASVAAFPDAAAGAPVAYVTSGTDYPDALSAGPAAVEAGGSLLLTDPAKLDESVTAELVRLHPASVVVVGGTGAVSDAVFGALEALPFDHVVSRVAGADRYATSRAVVEQAFGTAVPRIVLATGAGFADALTAGAAAAGTGRPVLLIPGDRSTADADTVAELAKLDSRSATVVGGASVISDGVVRTLGDGISVRRSAGSDRFQTAAVVATSTFPSAATVYLANSKSFPDALAGTVLAARTQSPLFLSPGDCTPQSAFAAMLSMHTTSLTVLGGYGAMYGSVVSSCGY
ncbi:cell wall-binding repeat-containing protein [Leifsonia sp. NPDC058292]|uniref:cell wall-binding repeat-containing protein n=1 Tax=Leifsonia sp. NPDC058292 TaxID=3346428 RepID=UPI0036D91728